jgi:hypothetical protein
MICDKIPWWKIEFENNFVRKEIVEMIYRAKVKTKEHYYEKILNIDKIMNKRSLNWPSQYNTEFNYWRNETCYGGNQK